MKAFPAVMVLFALPIASANAQNALGALKARAYVGDAKAQFELGVAYQFGEGVPENDAEAVMWYRLAAVQGDAKAQNYLGRMYDNGEGVAEDNVEAVKWYRLAADQGDASAQLNLGLMYALGQGVPMDYVQASAWWNLAAAKGNDNAKLVKAFYEARKMTREQIEEAQWLSSQWKSR